MHCDRQGQPRQQFQVVDCGCHEARDISSPTRPNAKCQMAHTVADEAKDVCDEANETETEANTVGRGQQDASDRVHGVVVDEAKAADPSQRGIMPANEA